MKLPDRIQHAARRLQGDAARFELDSVQTSYTFPQTSPTIILERAGIASEFCCRFAKLSLGSTEQDAVARAIQRDQVWDAGRFELDAVTNELRPCCFSWGCRNRRPGGRRKVA